MRVFPESPQAQSLEAGAFEEAARDELERAWAFWRSHAIELQTPGDPHRGRTRIPNLYHPKGRRGGGDSEYQSFSMLFAVWFNDPQTFDYVWSWTQRHLQRRPHDKLLWWAKYDNGELGWGTAADGELGCMLALLLAARRWGNKAYREMALTMAGPFREKCVARIADRLVIAAGANDPGARDFWDREKGLVCFSNYLMIYALRVLAEAHPQGDWARLIPDSVSLLTESESLYAHGFPPMTFRVRFSSGQVVPPNDQTPPWNSFANVSSCRYLSFMLMDAAGGGRESQTYLARFNKLEEAYAQTGTLPWGWQVGQHWGPDCWPLLALLAAKRHLAGDGAMAKAVLQKASSLWRTANPAVLPGEYLFNHACAMLALIPATQLIHLESAA